MFKAGDKVWWGGGKAEVLRVTKNGVWITYWPYRREHAIRRRSLYLLYRQSLTRIGDTSIVSKGHCKNFPLL
jgi:hypothetical protein